MVQDKRQLRMDKSESSNMRAGLIACNQIIPEKIRKVSQKFHKSSKMLQKALAYDYYGKAIGFMRDLFSDGFRDNSNLSFGFLTDVLQVAKDSVFSGKNVCVLLE